jgi:hypothetical protein
VYRALLESEREDYYRHGETIMHEGRELQVTWADPNDHTADCFCAPRKLLDLLEAGKSVVLRRSTVQAALWDRDRSRWRPPFDRSVRFVQVNPDDTIVSARDLDPHLDGRVAEGC